jgi:hypothetical protein
MTRQRPVSSPKIDADTRPGSGPSSGRQLQSGPPSGRATSRGSSVQGEKQPARGGPEGANQGGAPRGASRLDPSHTRRNPEHYTGKRTRGPKG